jgi:hypothetical protein
VEDMKKTRYKDLVVINYKSQGLAENIPETHQIVLANRSKIRVRSGRGSGWTWLQGSKKI